jgi:hypothetical protein
MGLFQDCGCGCNGKKQEAKMLTSLLAALVFYIIASPEMYQITRRVIGSWVSGPTGCASEMGLIVHAVVFFFVTWGLMNVTAKKM